MLFWVAFKFSNVVIWKHPTNWCYCEIDMRIHYTHSIDTGTGVTVMLTQRKVNSEHRIFNVSFYLYNFRSRIALLGITNEAPLIVLRNLKTNIFWRKTNRKIGTFARSFCLRRKAYCHCILDKFNFHFNKQYYFSCEWIISDFRPMSYVIAIRVTLKPRQSRSKGKKKKPYKRQNIWLCHAD